ncbi:hypothetical protein [Candidatus Endomicrobiellum devescovinae]|uniref:hypothetical protein n=1 Tax=Candidatus Endomicrobiellum devescovinae TaxID=3242322 RepID=UPI002824AAFB|nr:hypothetical protein [Endomicrobium sp.]
MLNKKTGLEAIIKADNKNPEVFRLSRETIVKIFKSSEVDTKNKILNLILRNLTLKEKVLDFSYKSPFEAVPNFTNGTLGVADGT